MSSFDFIRLRENHGGFVKVIVNSVEAQACPAGLASGPTTLVNQSLVSHRRNIGTRVNVFDIDLP